MYPAFSNSREELSPSAPQDLTLRRELDEVGEIGF
jgi:hypothetical protein